MAAASRVTNGKQKNTGTGLGDSRVKENLKIYVS